MIVLNERGDYILFYTGVITLRLVDLREYHIYKRVPDGIPRLPRDRTYTLQHVLSTRDREEAHAEFDRLTGKESPMPRP